MDWQPIETAPKDGTNILLCQATDADGDPIVDDAWGVFVQVADPPLHFTPTHWAPLPPNPLAPSAERTGA
jgi:hypothetical protein